MSSALKFGLLALVSTAAAIPQYGHNNGHNGHNRFHKSSGAAYPTGGWGGSKNSTAPGATGTGTAVYPGEQTTTIDETLTSTTTLVSTIYMSPSPVGGNDEPSSVGGVDVSTSADAVCGPETIYVTATNKVTVTVTAGDAPSSTAEPAASSSSSAAPGGGDYEAPSKVPEVPETPVETPSNEEGKITVSLPQKGRETPTPSGSKEDVYSILPVISKTPVKEAPVETPAPSKPEAPVEAPKESSTSASADKSTPSKAPSYSGGKRGLAYNDPALCQSFAGKASWAYSWGSVPGGELPAGTQFVPMPWVKNEDAASWLKNVDKAVEAGSKVVMGFNEVDHPAQANMLPEVACQKWSEYMNPIASAHPDVTILGPSVTNNREEENWGLKWLQKFDSVCPGAVYHATNVHFYDIFQDGEGTQGTIGRFIDLIESAHKQSGKKVWVTEFGLNPGSSAEDTTTFLTSVLKYMDGSNIVDGYSYFMVGSGENQLNANGGLSAIGQIYASA